MYVRPTAMKRLMREIVGDNPISEGAYYALALRLEQVGFDIVHEARRVLEIENENRRLQGLKPKVKITDRHIRLAIEGIKGAWDNDGSECKDSNG